jgi:hypothetical protein
MKHATLSFFCLIITVALNAQLKSAFDSATKVYRNKITSNNNFNHNIFFNLQNNILEYQPIEDNSVLKLPEPELLFEENIDGFNIYKATPDNIYIAKPDGSISFSMPVAGRKK